jgi:hypothetical protein
MTASTKPKTPSMTIPIRKDIPRSQIELFCKKASRVALSQLVDSVSVQERLVASQREYTVEMTFFPEDEYHTEHDLTPSEILSALATTFAVTLAKEVKTEEKKLDADVKGQIKQVGKGRAAPVNEVATGGGDNDDVDEDEGISRRREEERSDLGDGDAEDEKRARQSKQQATYESDDEAAGGEYDENQAIEDAYADGNDGAESDDEDAKGTSRASKQPSFEDNIGAARASFESIFTRASEFDFKEDRCTFKLAVRFP